MKNILKKAICTVLTMAIMLTLYAVPSYATTNTAFIESAVVDKVNSTISVSCRFPSGKENRIATVILAKEEIAPNEAIDLSNGKVENIMMAPIDYNGDMSLTVGYADVRNYILYVICEDVRLEKAIDLSSHLASFNLSDEYGAISAATTKERLEKRLEELPDEVSVVAPVTVDNQLEIYVSNEGLDSYDGSEAKPLKTIDAALSKLAEAGKSGTIVLRGGTYNISSTVNINASHAHGTSNDSVTMIKAYPGEKVYFESNPSILASDFQPLDEETAKSIIDETARSKVLQVNIPSGYDVSVPSKLKLYINGNEMMQSRWPNNSEVRMGTVTADKEDGWTTKYLTLYKDRLNMWDFAARNIYFNGCFNNAEYAPTVTLVRNYDKATGEITTGSSWAGGANPTAENATHFYCNVLEEIDVPGEWCVDKNGTLYVYPTEGFENSEIVLGTEGNTTVEHMIKISDANRLVFDGITFRYAKSAVFAQNCNDLIFQNCNFSNISDRAVVFEKCKYSGVINSELANIGRIAVEFTYDDDGESLFDSTLNDADFYNVIPSRNFVQGCVINGVNGADNTGAVVDRWGIGNIFSHNVIGNVTNNGFLFTNPMEHIVEYNEIFSFAQDISDSGAVYFGSLRSRGNMIRHNYIHDPLKGGVGVYFDNMSGGNYAYGNVIKNCLVGFSTNGGRDNAFAGNIVINDVEKFDKDVTAIYNNPWEYLPAGTTFWEDTVVPQAQKLIASDWYTSPTITQRYTEWKTQLDQIKAYVDEKEASGTAYKRGDAYDKTDKQNIARGLSGNYIGKNMVVGTDNHMEELLTKTHLDANGANHGKPCWMWGIDGFCDENGATAGINTNVTYNSGSQAGFADYSNDNFALVNSGEFNIPFGKMGSGSQKANMSELEFYGVNYTRLAETNDVCNISWSSVNGAEKYTVTIATDAEFKNVVSQGTVRDTMYNHEGDLFARPYYIRIEYTTTAKLYSTKTKTVQNVFKTNIPQIELTDREEKYGDICFKLKNNTGEDIITDVYMAQYEGDCLKTIEMLSGETINKDNSLNMNITPVSDYQIKVFLWDSNQKPYTDEIILK